MLYREEKKKTEHPKKGTAESGAEDAATQDEESMKMGKPNTEVMLEIYTLWENAGKTPMHGMREWG